MAAAAARASIEVRRVAPAVLGAIDELDAVAILAVDVALCRSSPFGSFGRERPVLIAVGPGAERVEAVDDVIVGEAEAEIRLRTALRLFEARAAAAAARDRDDRVALALGPFRFGTWTLDLSSGRLVVDDALAAVFAIDAPSCTELSAIQALVHPEDRPVLDRAFAEALGGGGLFDVEHRVLTPDGVERWVQCRATVDHDERDAPVRVRGTVLDVTARKVAELSLRRAYEEVRASDERFRIVARATSDLVWDWDLETDVVTWSENLTALFGWTPKGQRTPLSWWEQIIHPEDRARVTEGIRAALASGSDHWADEYRFARADGLFATVFDRGVVIRSEPGRGGTGKPLRMIGAIMDITERRELQARLVLADRLASVGTLAAGVAHEINNPLAYVLANIGNARTLLAATPAKIGTALEALAQAADGADRVRRIVSDLKTFARAPDEIREPIDLRNVARSAIALVSNEIRHRARLVRELGEAPMVLGNAGRLAQVVVNLLVNAAQAIPEGAADRHEVRIRTATDDLGRAMLEVVDDGHGIAKEIVPRIFDPFFTTKAHGEGTGLGLTICHGIVTGLGGSIDVVTTQGEGTRFRVILPAAPAEALVTRREIASSPAEAGVRGRMRRILIVDDEPMIGKAVQLMLADAHDVVAMVSARDALIAVENGEDFDAILCDLMMPEMTGMELHAELARSAPALARRMVFLTGGAFTQRARAFLESTANPRLEKPFDPAELRAAIDAALAR